MSEALPQQQQQLERIVTAKIAANNKRFLF